VHPSGGLSDVVGRRAARHRHPLDDVAILDYLRAGGSPGVVDDNPDIFGDDPEPEPVSSFQETVDAIVGPPDPIPVNQSDPIVKPASRDQEAPSSGYGPVESIPKSHPAGRQTHNPMNRRIDPDNPGPDPDLYANTRRLR
jgi:hypothetical protein